MQQKLDAMDAAKADAAKAIVQCALETAAAAEMAAVTGEVYNAVQGGLGVNYLVQYHVIVDNRLNIMRKKKSHKKLLYCMCGRSWTVGQERSNQAHASLFPMWG